MIARNDEGIDPRALVVAVQVAAFIGGLTGANVMIAQDTEADEGDALVSSGDVDLAVVRADGQVETLATIGELASIVQVGRVP